MSTLYVLSHLIIMTVCAWATANPNVTKGIVVKYALALLSVSSLACVAHFFKYQTRPTNTDVMFVLAAAVLSLRCLFIKTRIKKIIKCKYLEYIGR